jgi:hypothetical protein
MCLGVLFSIDLQFLIKLTIQNVPFLQGISASIDIISGNPSNVFWILGTSATIGANTEIQGTLLAKVYMCLYEYICIHI